MGALVPVGHFRIMQYNGPALAHSVPQPLSTVAAAITNAIVALNALHIVAQQLPQQHRRINYGLTLDSLPRAVWSGNAGTGPTAARHQPRSPQRTSAAPPRLIIQ